MSDLKKIKDEFLIKLKGKLNLSEINQIKSDLFGKNGLVSSQFKKIGSIAETERKKFASDLNIIKDELQNLIETKINEIQNAEINEKLEKEKIDITLPERSFVRASPCASLNRLVFPLSIMPNTRYKLAISGNSANNC